MANVILFNKETREYEEIPSERVRAALDSGKYTSEGGVRTTAGLVRDPGDIAALEQLGEGVDEGAQAEASVKSFEDDRRARLEGKLDGRDRVMVFADGVADALSLGFLDADQLAMVGGSMAPLHQKINDAIDTEIGNESLAFSSDERTTLRDEKWSGTRVGGQIVGTVVGLGTPGAVSVVAKGGRKAGQALTKALLGTARAEKSILTARVLKEAGEGAALGFAHGLGTQLGDVVFDDKPFVAEAVLHETGMGGLLGAGFGALGGLAGLAKGSRSQVAASGGLLDVNSALSKEVHGSVKEAVKSFDNSLDELRFRVGIVEQVAKEGHIPVAWADEAVRSLRATERAQARLRALNVDSALSNGISRKYLAWRRVMENYQGQLVALDDIMASTARASRATYKAKPGQFNQSNVPPDAIGKKLVDVPDEMAVSGKSPGRSFEEPGGVGIRMAVDDQAQAAYRKLHGRAWDEGRGAVDAAGEIGVKPATQSMRAAEEVLPNQGVQFENVGPGFKRDSGVLPRQAMGLAEQPGGTLVGQAPGPRPAGDPGGSVFEPAMAGRMDDLFVNKGGKDPLSISNRGTAELPSQMPGGATQNMKAQRAPLELEPSVTERPAKSFDAVEDPDVVVRREAGRKAVEDYFQKWYDAVQKRGPKASPADVAAARVGEVMDKISQLTNGKLDSTAATDLFGAMGFQASTNTFGSQLDQLMVARQLGNAVADASRGMGNPARKAGRDSLLRWLGARLGYAGARGLVGGAIGWSAAGPLGAILGARFVDQILGTTGRAASAAGRVTTLIGKAVDGILKNGRGVAIASGLRSYAMNKPVAYSDAGPIQDPVERIQEIKRLAASPDAIEAIAMERLGDDAVLNPDLARNVVDLLKQRIVKLSLKAPAIYWDRLGRPLPPSSQEMRRWHLYENATNDLVGTLKAVQAGSATDEQYEALRTQHPGALRVMVKTILGRQGDLSKLERSALKRIEKLTGMPLTNVSDPNFLARQMQAWQIHNASPLVGGSINAPMSTPASAQIAPGNE